MICQGFQELNCERIDGFEISVELAKESFLERLKRERSENKLKKEKPSPPITQEFPKLDSTNGTHIGPKPKHKTFSDLDVCSKNLEIKETKKKRRHNQETEEIEQLQVNWNEESFERSFEEKSHKKTAGAKECVDRFRRDKAVARKKLKIERVNDSIQLDSIKSKDFETNEKPVINESEKKRLMSLRQKKQIFKTQEQTIRNALRFVVGRYIN